MLKKKEDKLLLTRDEEFQLMKLVLDKFLWLGTAGMAVGLYMILNPSYNENTGLLILLTGALILLLFTAVIMRNFHIHRKFK